MKNLRKKGLLALLVVFAMVLCVMNPAQAVRVSAAEHEANVDESLRLNYTSCTLYYLKEKEHSYDKEETNRSTVLPLRVYNNTSGTVKFSSSNKKVAKVGEDGIVTPQGTGKCNINVKVGKKKLKCKITVLKMPTEAEFNKKVTYSSKLKDGCLIITVKNQLKLPVVYSVAYKQNYNDGSISDYQRANMTVLPGGSRKFYYQLSNADKTVAIKKMGSCGTIAGSSKNFKNKDFPYMFYNYQEYAMLETKNAELYIDDVRRKQNWLGSWDLYVDYTIVNNEPYAVQHKACVVFYQENKIVKVLELYYSDYKYKSGATSDSRRYSGDFEYDRYEVVNNEFYIRY